MDKSVGEFYNMRIEMKRNWRMSFYCNSMRKNKNLGHLLVNKSYDDDHGDKDDDECWTGELFVAQKHALFCIS